MSNVPASTCWWLWLPLECLYAQQRRQHVDCRVPLEGAELEAHLKAQAAPSEPMQELPSSSVQCDIPDVKSTPHEGLVDAHAG